ncbi:MAG: DNA polymerase III subunit gamma/tau, partial [Clostridia bacterium]|nr:DNA polymerase III subunit gamma/tau [Clostridia bacterium]
MGVWSSFTAEVLFFIFERRIPFVHQALYRKWRPPHFDEVYGQDHITSILKYQCATGKFSHAYLFCGSRGTGKTTCAKILAKAVNCLNPTSAGPCGECAACRSIDSGAATDVLEMDAASNNGVDDIRDIRDEVIYSPSELKYRVYIIDEVHMLSTSAFNALLKTLEEPPEHVVFILATTELQKL